MMRPSLSMGFALIWMVSTLWAGPAKTHIVASRSVGSPNEGRLEGAVRLVPSESVRFVPSTTGTNAQWGSRALVDLLSRATRAVARDYPKSKASVGHLSLEHGGDILGHASHESGRDVDVAFYVLGKNRKQAYPERYVKFDGAGNSTSEKGYLFDDAKNWAFVKHLLNDSQVGVQRIFVAAPIRARLLSYAKNSGELPELVEKAAMTLAEPANVQPHDDHFHVRIGCPAGSIRCIENPKVQKPSKPNGRTAGRKSAPPREQSKRPVSP